MKKHFILFFTLITFVCFFNSCQEDEAEEIVPEEKQVMSGEALEAFQLVNAHRESKGLQPLIHHNLVYDVAKEHTENMANGSVPFSHEGFSARVSSLKESLSISSAGENVAYISRSNAASSIVDMWLESSGHRKNIENGSFTHTGMAMVKSNEGLYYYTQFFIKLKEE